MARMIKPTKLQKGDTVACITLSWAGASVCSDRYKKGKEQIENQLGVKIIDTPHACKDEDWIANNPKKRLYDLIWAIKNPDVKAIFSIIGGNDCIRLMEYLTEEDKKIIRENPKIFVGLSDTTIINMVYFKLGLVSFYGPSVLFGLAENGGIDAYTIEYLKKSLFTAAPTGRLRNNAAGWTTEKIKWIKENENKIRVLSNPLEIKFLSSSKPSKGIFIGGCMETLEAMKGTSLWPTLEEWDNKILFLELANMSVSEELFSYWLRNYGAQGILKRLNGIVFAIPGQESEKQGYMEKLCQLEETLKKVCKEYGREDLEIVSRVQIGHICPMMTIPLGVEALIDSSRGILKITENGVKDNEKTE